LGGTLSWVLRFFSPSGAAASINGDQMTKTMAHSPATLIAIAVLVAAPVGTSDSQSAVSGSVKPFSAIQWTQDSDVKCLRYAVEAGDPDNGPSTQILSFPKGCAYSWHYHTAEEQLLVSQGIVSVQMGDMPEALLATGGFAVMPSRESHRFSCVSAQACVAFVHFDRKYDIFWQKQK
jgi:quercetin dioxygenase-like cupin family protein